MAAVLSIMGSVGFWTSWPIKRMSVRRYHIFWAFFAVAIYSALQVFATTFFMRRRIHEIKDLLYRMSMSYVHLYVTLHP